VEVGQDRAVLITVRAAVEPLVTDRVIIRLTRFSIHPSTDPSIETTASVHEACRLIEQWLNELMGATDETGT
jgi:hypothetical protein